ncbi:MAG TPA: hypothetical protein VHV77_11530 [Pirellulales bacterium]|nr:hypothetical protein [Pirellulales bacterium]
MRIGIDFDNTIVCYDQVFHQVAGEQGLLNGDVPVTKEAVRDHLRAHGLEQTWIEMQGYVYGARMHDAQPFDGVVEFFAVCRQKGIETCIISHKTKHPFAGPGYDLHEAARTWLKSQPFSGADAPGRAPQVFLELTKQDKLRRIELERCDWFIDDLPEFLSEASFPSSCKRWLFDPHRCHATTTIFAYVSSWDVLQRELFNKVKAA